MTNTSRNNVGSQIQLKVVCCGDIKAFSSSSRVRTEDDVMARIEALQKISESRLEIGKKALSESVADREEENHIKSYITLGKKADKEHKNMFTYLMHY